MHVMYLAAISALRALKRAFSKRVYTRWTRYRTSMPILPYRPMPADQAAHDYGQACDKPSQVVVGPGRSELVGFLYPSLVFEGADRGDCIAACVHQVIAHETWRFTDDRYEALEGTRHHFTG